ncbi:hypothetical protein ZIOFF_053655 [Zingiber officinale]|uniref:Glucan endo-1,3-beta-D-glucosidase n=1 Tax=Zingiber officinale TaxID=94328 RepID=A0A8J5FT40_ZINOF|nr:hypothetical protein ZIOFF_053655 [Zingiber officinale]
MATSNIHYSSIAIVIVVLIVSTAFMVPTRVTAIGVCYGRLGDNLPPPPEVVALFESNQIDRMRIYEPYPDVLAALAGSNIGLIVGTLNQDVQPLALDISAAQTWVGTNIVPHINNANFRYINVGNEIIPSDMAQFVLPAMSNVQSALVANNITTIKVTTSVATTVLGVSYPPSAGDFSDATKEIINSIVHFLAVNEAPLLVNMYPYFAYKDNSNDISLDYALFNAIRVGGASVDVVVSESGWPSTGDFGASVDNAYIYNQNLINHVVKETPKKPEVAIETYLFALFNENQKGPADLEKFFGLFFPNKTPVYQLKFT